MIKKPKDIRVLSLDIETRPTTAYVWRAWDERVSPAQVIDNGGMMCVGAKWLGEKKVMMFSEWEHGHKGMLEGIHALISEADILVTFNGDRFDLPKINGEFLLHDLPPAPPVTSVDVLKIVKKMGFFMNRLAYIAPLLGVGSKMENEGFGLWKKVMDGDVKAQRRMEKYCVQDVIVLEDLYLKVRPYMKNHPNIGQKDACPSCGSRKVQSRGYYRTRMFKTQRLHCQSCGAWHTGTRTKI